MASVFSKIVKGDIPSYKVAETDSCYAFLDINPLKEGHTLVIPKKEVDYLFDLDEQTYVELQLFARKVARAVRAAVPCKRVGVAVLGMEVPHAHIHLVPLDSEGDMDFRKTKLSLSGERFEALAASIAVEYAKL
ncbi:MAG TPA: HIT family protein [Candidatus Coprenecus avistercoris]|uniref:HIT family protein n=1 Tax=Candidatus Coprenecus avistercoris TaxID=2840730 RepID=A0A9D1E1K7_9BACT|nr:HIT family protein [Candidatus Coprenecus avistercoris]